MVELKTEARSGYTLPVFACAAAVAALRHLSGQLSQPSTVAIDLLEPAETATIPIEQVACLGPQSALAITRSDPGDNLDLTRHTPIWAWVEWGTPDQPDQIVLVGGEGLGRQGSETGQPAIYAYARRLLTTNLERWLSADQNIRVTIVLPEGRALAERTSNAAFGIVAGLSLLGTSGLSQALSAPAQLEAYRQELREKGDRFACLVFCIGENGRDLAIKLGYDPAQIVKTANWLGPLLAEAGVQQVPSILLFGYHGKLIKLAGGVFHTHHAVADARQEILTAHCAQVGLPTSDLQAIFASPTAESALQYLRQRDQATSGSWVAQAYGAIAQQIDRRAQRYIYDHSQQQVQVGSILFDRDRQIIVTSEVARELSPSRYST